MHAYGNFFEANWVQTYKYTDQTWLVDSLNWEKISTPALLDTGILSFLQNSSFLNQHLTVDFSTKISYLDIILLNSVNFTNSVLVLYNSYIYDLYNQRVAFEVCVAADTPHRCARDREDTSPSEQLHDAHGPLPTTLPLILQPRGAKYIRRRVQRCRRAATSEGPNPWLGRPLSGNSTPPAACSDRCRPGTC